MDIKSERTDIEQIVDLNEARQFIVESILSGPRRARFEQKLGFQLAEAFEHMLTARLHTVESFSKQFEVPEERVRKMLSGEFTDVTEMMEVADALGYALNIELLDLFAKAHTDEPSR